MKNYIEGKVIIITGAGSGFGKLISEKAGAMGAKLVCKVSIVRPTGVPDTGLGSTVINPEALNGILGQNAMEAMTLHDEMPNRPELLDKEKISYYFLEPESLAENVLYVINQPWGVNIGDITVRASAEPYIL